MEILIRDMALDGAALAARIVRKVVTETEHPVLGLATGTTMVPVYEELARLHERGELSFATTTTFNLDEYVGVPPHHPGSFHSFMHRHLFDRVDLDTDRAHLPDGLAPDLRRACAEYEARIAAAGGIDLQLLGLGRNGHIGFNEPTGSLASRTWVKILSRQTIADNAQHFADDPQRVPRHALTMGVATILDARQCLLVACGEAKAEAVRRMVEGPVSASCPASTLQLHPRTVVVLDRAAASGLELGEHYRWIERHKLGWQRFD